MSSEVPKGLVSTHQGIYHFTDRYNTKVTIVKSEDGIHISVIGGSSVSLPNEVLKFVTKGPTCA